MNLTFKIGAWSAGINNPAGGIITTGYTSTARDERYTDTITVAIVSNTAGNFANLRYLEDYAARRKRFSSLPKLWLERNLASVTSLAEVYDLTLQVSADFYDRYNTSAPVVAIRVVRSPFYSPKVAIPLKKGAGTPTTDWLSVGNVEHAEYSGGDASGDEESPIELQIKNTSAGDVADVLVGISRRANYAQTILEGENASGGTQKPASPDASYSNGYYSEVSVTSTASRVLTWDISNIADTLAGYPYLVLFRPAGTWPAGLRAKATVDLPGGYVTVAETTPVIVSESGELAYLGTLSVPYLPAGLQETQTVGSYELSLWLWGTTANVGVDYLELIGIDGGIRRISLAKSLAANEVLVINEMEGWAYIAAPDSKVQVHGTVAGSPLRVRKGESGIIIVKTAGAGGHIARSVSLKVAEYPRSSY